MSFTGCSFPLLQITCIPPPDTSLNFLILFHSLVKTLQAEAIQLPKRKGSKTHVCCPRIKVSVDTGLYILQSRNVPLLSLTGSTTALVLAVSYTFITYDLISFTGNENKRQKSNTFNLTCPHFPSVCGTCLVYSSYPIGQRLFLSKINLVVLGKLIDEVGKINHKHYN